MMLLRYGPNAGSVPPMMSPGQAPQVGSVGEAAKFGGTPGPSAGAFGAPSGH